jgi:hypothetical protein
VLHAALRRARPRNGAVVRVGVRFVEADDAVAPIRGAASPEIK